MKRLLEIFKLITGYKKTVEVLHKTGEQKLSDSLSMFDKALDKARKAKEQVDKELELADEDLHAQVQKHVEVEKQMRDERDAKRDTRVKAVNAINKLETLFDWGN